MILPLILFFIGLFLLIKGADLLVEGAEQLAARMGVSPALIGLTVVAFGTSVPELVVSTGAFFTGSYEIGLGNLIGSNIANIGLILALCFLLIPLSPAIGKVSNTLYSRERLVRDAVMTLIATLVFAFVSLRGVLDFLSASVFLLVFALIIQLYWRASHTIERPSEPGPARNLLRIPGGLAGVILGAYLLLNGATQIAIALNISSYVIGLSMVAVGTSLPELSTSVVAILKKNYDISIGNILGSNVFNILFIPAISSFFLTIPVADYTSIIIMIAFSLGLFPFFLKSQKMVTIWALFILAAWVTYIAFIYGVF